MNLALVSAAIETRITGDTGTGGLMETGGGLINGVWFDTPIGGAAKPFVVVSFPSSEQDDTFAKDAVDISVEFVVAIDRRSGTFATDSAILKRLEARFHRWAMTLTGYNATAMGRISGTTLHDEQTRHYVEQYAVRIEEA